MSAGEVDGDTVGILVNGLSPFHDTNPLFSKNYGEGLNVAVLHPETGKYVGFEAFKMLLEDRQFHEFVTKFPVGFIVVIGVKGTTASMSLQSRLVIESLGSNMARNVEKIDGFAMVGRIRAAPGSAEEELFSANDGLGKLRIPKFRLSPVKDRSDSVDIHLYSGGADDTNSAHIFVNGIARKSNDQINLAVIDKVNGTVKEEVAYSTVHNKKEIVTFLGEIENGDTLLVAVKGNSGENSFNDEIRNAFVAVGSSEVLSLGYRDSWVMVSKIGANESTEKLSTRYSGPAELKLFNYNF